MGRWVPRRRLPRHRLPFVPGQEIAGVVEAASEGAGVQPGERVYAVLFPAGGGVAELALASADQLAPMPASAGFQQAADLVFSARTAKEGLVDRGQLRAGETVLITAAAGGVGSAAVQIAVAVVHAPSVWPALPTRLLARPGRSEVFDYHAADWVSRCVRRFRAASMCCWIAPAARPVTTP